MDVTTDESPRDPLLERISVALAAACPDSALAALAVACSESDDQAFVASFLQVHRETVALETVPECRVELRDVEARMAPQRRLSPRWIAAAAALLIVATGVVAAWQTTRRPLVRLTTMARSVVATADVDDDLVRAAASVTGVVADFVPLRDGAPEWLTSYETGRDVARVSGRPLLVFIHHPTCPWCLEMRGSTFGDPRVAELLTRFVPVMVDVTALPDELQPRLAQGWPYFGVLDAEGTEIVAFPGLSDADVFASHLEAAGERTEVDAAPPWGPLRAHATRYRTALALRASGDLRGAVAELTALAQEPANDAFSRSARRTLSALADEARDVLVEAHRAADAGPLLDAALVRFDGTPWAPDLRAVREALRETGRFPRLEPLVIEDPPNRDSPIEEH